MRASWGSRLVFHGLGDQQNGIGRLYRPARRRGSRAGTDGGWGTRVALEPHQSPTQLIFPKLESQLLQLAVQHIYLDRPPIHHRYHQLHLLMPMYLVQVCQ